MQRADAASRIPFAPREGSAADGNFIEEAMPLGRLGTGWEVLAARTGADGWGIAVRGPGASSFAQQRPVRIELLREDGEVEECAAGYDTVVPERGGFLAKARVRAGRNVAFDVEDRWTVSGEVLALSRRVLVLGGADGGFLSGVSLLCEGVTSLADVNPFAPGLIYGLSKHVTGAAIGGLANYLAGVRQLLVREDRLPAPLFGLHFGDGTSVTVLDTEPYGATTAEDSYDVEATTLVDERFGFGAVGGFERGDGVAVGFCFPGTEGEITYRGDTYPGGQLRRWRGRYHPVRDGATQRYRVAFRFGRDEDFEGYRRVTWRWAWDTLCPAVNRQDVDLVRWSSAAMAADRVATVGGKSGIPLVWDATTGRMIDRDQRAVMGFLGKNPDLAYYLLRESYRGAADAERLRRLGTAILDSFALIRPSPPQAEGFDLEGGAPRTHRTTAQPHDRVHLRALAEGAKFMLRAWRHEADRGRDHKGWLRWATSVGDWLLGEQRPDGGFPRAWQAGTGRVAVEAPESSYNAVPLLTLLSEETGAREYLEAAARAGEFCWVDGQREGHFVGGTLDNPNVIDKEAGTVSLEGYLRLYEATGEARWLRRARAAADFAETWIYCWNVPMPEDADEAALGWKKGVPTVGMQLISTGHSLADCYMAHDVAEYAKLYAYTGDEHYLKVAEILLHNTKGMMAVPGRTHDLAGPGWQQEHWSLAPRRGHGMHRYWLPWVSVSILQGIVELEDFDSALYERLAGGRVTTKAMPLNGDGKG